MTRMEGGYWMREIPARSAPAYEHQLQRKATMRGSKGAAADLGWACSGGVSGFAIRLRLQERDYNRTGPTVHLPMANAVLATTDACGSRQYAILTVTERENKMSSYRVDTC
jgi:hypothetical protein